MSRPLLFGWTTIYMNFKRGPCDIVRLVLGGKHTLNFLPHIMRIEIKLHTFLVLHLDNLTLDSRIKHSVRILPLSITQLVTHISHFYIVDIRLRSVVFNNGQIVGVQTHMIFNAYSPLTSFIISII